MTRYGGLHDSAKNSVQAFQQIIGALFSGGSALINSSTSWKVTQRIAGANMSIDIGAGSGLIPNSGSFPFAPWSDATENVTVTTADPSNPRRDIVVAYLDQSVPSTAATNAPNALKFKVVTGTAAASPSDPTSSTIQISVGAGNPWVYLARVRLGTPGSYSAPSTVTDSMIDDLRQPISFKGRLWGGSNNTNGHLVPNVADGTVIVSSDIGTVQAQNLAASAIKLGRSVRTTDFTSSTNVETLIAGLTTTVTIPAGGRDVEIEVYSPAIGTTSTTVVNIYDGIFGSGGTKIGQSNVTTSNGFLICKAFHTPSAGSHTYSATISAITGNPVFGAAANGPSYLQVKAI